MIALITFVLGIGAGAFVVLLAVWPVLMETDGHKFKPPMWLGPLVLGLVLVALIYLAFVASLWGGNPGLWSENIRVAWASASFTTFVLTVGFGCLINSGN